MSVCLQTKWLWVRVTLLSLKTSAMAPASSKKFLDIHASYRVWIHSQTCTWHDNNIQSNALYRKLLTTQLNHLNKKRKKSWPVWLNGWVLVYELMVMGSNHVAIKYPPPPSPPLPTTLFLTIKTKLDWIPSKIKWKIDVFWCINIRELVNQFSYFLMFYITSAFA